MLLDMDTQDFIYLTYLNGTGYIFKVEDYLQIRKKYRIVGAPVGKSWKKSWSVHELTMPIELTQWETLLLLQKGIAVLVSKKCSLLRSPTHDEYNEYGKNSSKCAKEQTVFLKEEKLRDAEKNMEKILAGKRKKMLKEGKSTETVELNASAVLDEIIRKFVPNPNDSLLEIPTAHTRVHEGEVIHMPSNLESQKYHVFRDIWSRGKFITGGDAFGADFLIYPGDPMLYHASHILITLNSPTVRILDLVTKVRLSVIVNKICTFAYFLETSENDQCGSGVSYQTIRWLGNRDKDNSVT